MGMQERISRRDLARAGGALIVGVLEAACSTPPPPATPTLKPTEAPTPMPSASATPIPTAEPIRATPTPDYDRKPLDSLAREIVTLKPSSSGRNTLETTYARKALSLSETDLSAWNTIREAFWVITQPRLREVLIDRRFEKRQNRDSGTEQNQELTQEQIGWAVKSGIHPEILATCLDNFPEAERLLTKLQAKAGLNQPDFIASNHLINPGGMAALVTAVSGEAPSKLGVSYGFVHLGVNSLADNFNRGSGGNIDKELEQIAKRLQSSTQLPFKAETLPGRVMTFPVPDYPLIGLSTTPDQVLAIGDDFATIGRDFNPLDINSAILGIWYSLAKNRTITPDGRPLGYRRGEPFTSMRTIEHDMHIHPNQASSVYSSAWKYFDIFESEALTGNPSKKP